MWTRRTGHECLYEFITAVIVSYSSVSLHSPPPSCHIWIVDGSTWGFVEGLATCLLKYVWVELCQVQGLVLPWQPWTNWVVLFLCTAKAYSGGLPLVWCLGPGGYNRPDHWLPYKVPATSVQILVIIPSSFGSCTATQPCPPAGQPIRVLIVMVKLHPITFDFLCCRVYLIPPPIPLVSSGHNFYIDVCGGGSSSGGLPKWCKVNW